MPSCGCATCGGGGSGARADPCSRVLSGLLQKLASRGERVSCHAKLADEGIGLPEGSTAQFIKDGALPGAKGDTTDYRLVRERVGHEHAAGHAKRRLHGTGKKATTWPRARGEP
jgi:hypothetical protein